MKHFTKVADVPDVHALVEEALQQKKTGIQPTLKGKHVCLLFFNPSLRTRLSSEVATKKLGADVTVLNIGQEAWTMEFADGAVMNGNTTEHIKDAISVICQYYDVIGVRAFAGLTSREEDDTEPLLSAFLKYSTKPVVSLESAIRHPLQSLADLITIAELGYSQPKVAITWAPHPKALPHAVVNSFLEWIPKLTNNVTLACPKDYVPSAAFVKDIPVTHHQEEALEGADIVYCKSWSSYEQYGQQPPVEASWTVTSEKMKATNHGKFMHCMPIRRNVIATDDVIDNSVMHQQAGNRLYAASAVLKNLSHD